MFTFAFLFLLFLLFVLFPFFYYYYLFCSEFGSFPHYLGANSEVPATLPLSFLAQLYTTIEKHKALAKPPTGADIMRMLRERWLF
jgi:hypothetical protein